MSDNLSPWNALDFATCSFFSILDGVGIDVFQYLVRHHMHFAERVKMVLLNKRIRAYLLSNVKDIANHLDFGIYLRRQVVLRRLLMPLLPTPLIPSEPERFDPLGFAIKRTYGENLIYIVRRQKISKLHYIDSVAVTLSVGKSMVPMLTLFEASLYPSVQGPLSFPNMTNKDFAYVLDLTRVRPIGTYSAAWYDRWEARKDKTPLAVNPIHDDMTLFQNGGCDTIPDMAMRSALFEEIQEKRRRVHFVPPPMEVVIDLDTPLHIMLSQQGRSLIKYHCDLRADRNDINYQSKIKDNAGLAIEGVFIYKYTHVLVDENGHETKRIMCIEYLCPVQKNVLHST